MLNGDQPSEFLECYALRPWDSPGLCHGFMGRRGGVSTGPFTSLNFSYACGDEPGAVDTNWQRLRHSLPDHNVVIGANQVHGNVVHRVTAADSGTRLCGDGLVTADSGVVVSVLTADCVPILLWDRSNRIVGALHAGWRGVIGGIVSSGIDAMRALGAAPDKIAAATGPAIGQCCFEVDVELAERFAREIPSAARYSRPGRPGKAHLALRGIARDQLIESGVKAASIAEVGPCTCCEPQRFFSRRAARGATTGLQLSFIGLA